MNEREKYDEEYLDYCRREMHLTANTLRSYRQVIEQFWRLVEADMGVHSVAGVTREVASRYMRTLGENHKASSVKHHFGVIKKYFGYLEEIECIERSPFAAIKVRMKGEKRSPDVMTVDDVRKVLSAAYAGRPETKMQRIIYFRDCCVLEFLFGTGMRIHELCNIRIEDIDFERGTVSVLGKGLKHRVCYFLSEKFSEAYRVYLELRAEFLKEKGRSHSFVFINKAGEQLSTQAARNIVEKYVREAGLKKHVTPHSFRHTFASLLLEQGVELSYIQMYLGHSSISTTQIYLHISEENARSVLMAKHPRNRMDVLLPDDAG